MNTPLSTTPASRPEPRLGIGRLDSRASLTAYVAVAIQFAIVAEVLATFVSPLYGASMYAVGAFSLACHVALSATGGGRRVVAFALLSTAIVRIASLALPMASTSPVVWYVGAGTTGLLAAVVLIYSGTINLRQLGLTGSFTPVELALLPAGAALGYVGYIMVEPRPLVENPSIVQIVAFGLVLLVCSALVEELLIHGMFQSPLSSTLGWIGVVWSGLLFAVLYTGSRSPAAVLIAFVAGLLFGFGRYWTGSLWGPVGAHALMTISMLVVLPAVL